MKDQLSSFRQDSMIPFFHAHKPTKEVVDAAVNDLGPLLQEAEDAVSTYRCPD